MMECWWEINTAFVIMSSIDCCCCCFGHRHWNSLIWNRYDFCKHKWDVLWDRNFSKTFTFKEEKRTLINIINFFLLFFFKNKLIFWTDVFSTTNAPPKSCHRITGSLCVICFSWQEKLITYKRWLPFIKQQQQTNQLNESYLTCQMNVALLISFVIFLPLVDDFMYYYAWIEEEKRLLLIYNSFFLGRSSIHHDEKSYS